MRAKLYLLWVVLLAPLAACDTDDFWVATDGCPSSTGDEHDETGDDCVTGECEEEAVSIDAVAEIQAGPASHTESTRPGRPLTLVQERR
jgi:hypothetical protein